MKKGYTQIRRGNHLYYSVQFLVDKKLKYYGIFKKEEDAAARARDMMKIMGVDTERETIANITGKLIADLKAQAPRE